jgi:DmsE family decaheme c-type cytochrome
VVALFVSAARAEDAASQGAASPDAAKQEAPDAARHDASSEGVYFGDEVCLGCHEAVKDRYSHTVHAKLFTEQSGLSATMKRGCEGCHGPGGAHVEAGGGRGVGGIISFRAETKESRERENAVCLSCHSGSQRMHWNGSAHDSRELACSSCHKVMESLSEHALLNHRDEVDTCSGCHLIQHSRLFRNAHMPVREGKMTCSSCHNPHGTINPALLTYATVNENCQSCHADKRGPFLWEHPPVTENCLNCHDPHGSPRQGMLKASPPRLCQQCHLATRHPSSPRSPGDRFVVGSSCLQCHMNIHGSNHPSGFALTR